MRNLTWAPRTAALVFAFLVAAIVPATAQNILLGGAQDTAVLGASTVTNTGPSVISGDVDVSPGSAITGFPPGTVVNGSIHSSDAVANAAHAGALSAYNQLLGETPTSNLTGINLGGLTLLPGIYRFDTFAQLSGILTLDTQGNPNATFHFQIGTTLGADSASQITLLNGNSVNIFWQVGSSATLGTGSSFVGTIIADQSITLTTNATLQGRALALNGAVTLDSNTITAPTPSPSPTATPAPDPTATPTPGGTATPAPSPTATPDPGPTATPGATASPGPSGSPGPTPLGTATPTPLPTATPGSTPGPTATPGGTTTPTPLPGVTPSPSPGRTATPAPTIAPSLAALVYPTDLTIIPRIDLIITDIQVDNVIDRLTDLHHDVTRSTNKLTVIDAKDTSDSKDFLSDGKTMIDRRASAPAGPSIVADKRWGFFLTGTGEMVDVESTDTARGSSFHTGGVTVGADYRLTDHLAIGAAFGYANTEADLNFGGRVRSNNGSASLYATYHKLGFFVDGVITGGIGTIDTRRLTLGGVTRGNADTSDFAALLGTGYDCRFGNFTVGPVASLRFARAHLDSFGEGDAFGSLYLTTHDQDSLRSLAGLQASYRGYLGRTPVTPLLRAQWQHEFLDDTTSLDASFDNAHSFLLEGPHVGRDSLRLDAGFSAQLTPAISAFAIYSNELGRENYNAQSISGGVRVSF